MNLNILITNSDLESYYKSITHARIGDAGIDLITPVNVIIPSHSTVLVDLNIKCSAHDNNENPLSYYLRARSSIYKTPIRLSNAVGVIDSGYRGNIKMALDNIRDKDYVVEAGTRLVQICSPTLDTIKVNLVNELDNTERGGGGFGSTSI